MEQGEASNNAEQMNQDDPVIPTDAGIQPPSEDSPIDPDISPDTRDDDISLEPGIPQMSQIEIDRDESIYAQLIGAVANVRKMQTKS